MKIYKLPQMTNYKTLFDWICGLQQYPELILPEHDIQCDVYSPLAMLVYLCTQRIVPFLVTVVQCDGYLRICHGQHELQALRLFYENKLPVNQTQWYSSTPFFLDRSPGYFRDLTSGMQSYFLSALVNAQYIQVPDTDTLHTVYRYYNGLLR